MNCAKRKTEEFYGPCPCVSLIIWVRSYPVGLFTACYLQEYCFPNCPIPLDETTEEGRLCHKGIVLGGKKNSSEHHYRPYILCIVNHEMPWYFLSWVLGSYIYLYQETLYRSESCKRKLRRTSPCGPPGMATQVRPTYRQHYSCYAIACRSTWLLSSALSPTFLSQFHYRDAN